MHPSGKPYRGKIFLIVLLVAAIWLVSANVRQIQDAKRLGRLATTAVKSLPLEEKVYASGKVQAADQVAVYAPESGIVSHLKVKTGDRVEAGSVLLEIRSPDQQETLLTTVKAPSGGLIAQMEVEDGKAIQVGELIIRIINPEHLNALVSVNELDAAKIRVGQAARLTSEALPGQGLEGKVQWIAPEVKQVSNAPGDTACEVRLTLSGNGGLKPGMTIDAAIVTGERRALTVPASAVVERDGKPGVFLLTGEGVRFAAVQQTGLSNRDLVEIRGLSAGTRVVSTPSKELEEI